MRFVLLWLLCANMAYAQWEVSLRRASSIGVESLEFRLLKGKWTIQKRTNLFDVRPDLRLGELRPVDQRAFAEWPTILADVQKRHKDSIALLTAEGLDPKWLTPPPKHEPHIVLNGMFLLAETPAYKVLAPILRKQAELTYELWDGVALSTDQKTLAQYKNGKPGPARKFERQHHCTGNVCAFGNLGHLHLGVPTQ